MMRTFLSLTLAFACCLSAQCYAGELRITVQDGIINAGGSGFLDVLISSADVNPVNVDLANYEFLIEPINSPVGSLRFGAQISDIGDPLYPYFMLGNSFGIAREPGTPVQSLIASDLSLDSEGVDVLAQSLLVRLELVHELGPQSATLAAGETFNIKLVSGPATFFFSKADTHGDRIEHMITSRNGTVIIVAPAQSQVVPEPMSCLVFACGFATVIMSRRRTSQGIAS
jgi:hypothetical protein